MTVRRPKTRLRDRNRRTKVRRGWCRKNLHRLVGANVYVRPNGWRCCRVCQREQQAHRRVSITAELGYQRLKCIVRGCNVHVLRAPGREPYICRRHQIVLPEVA